MSLAGHFRLRNPEWGDSVSWGLAIVTALLFFVGIVVHERNWEVRAPRVVKDTVFGFLVTLEKAMRET